MAVKPELNKCMWNMGRFELRDIYGS
jgi:hypothetical protein